MEQDQYFKFEVNLLDDERITLLISEFGTTEAIGLYTLLLTYLRTSNDYEVSCKPAMLKAFSNRYKVNEEHLTRLIYEFDLFEVDDERKTFRSPYLDKVMEQLERRRKNCSANGKKGGRPKKREDGCAADMPLGTDGTESEKEDEKPDGKVREKANNKPNERQKRREEKKRDITTVVNNSSNISARENTVAAAVAPKDENLKRGKPQKRNSQKETNIVVLQNGVCIRSTADVQCYFCNYVAAGFTTGRILRQKLLAERDKTAAENVFRFEDQNTGRRSYYGHPIPDYAPPHPNNSAMWDDDHQGLGKMKNSPRVSMGEPTGFTRLAHTFCRFSPRGLLVVPTGFETVSHIR